MKKVSSSKDSMGSWKYFFGVSTYLERGNGFMECGCTWFVYKWYVHAKPTTSGGKKLIKLVLTHWGSL